ncbi:cation diffusion facilitator family transporter [Saccharothrix syringae]|uniref:hypothetical protein n=1 Tax=Saccharothrix syringae TaxID=103733 RepID=UPI000AA0A2BA|nr:hypothetical protein [Saccharothrix syringae]
MPIAVLLVATTMEGYALRTAVAESNRIRGSRSWAKFVRTAKAPELPVILLEDLGALLGLSFALVGVVMTPDHRAGPLGRRQHRHDRPALVVIAAVLAVETKSLLIGESAGRDQQAAIIAALTGEGVDSVIHLRTLHLGPEELLVAAKIAVGATDSAADVARTIDAAERRVRAAVPIAHLIYLEQDLRRPAG